LGDGLLASLTRQERIRTALDARTVLALDQEELFGERAAPQFLQTGELLDKGAYIERRGAEQRINFDLLIHNAGTLPLRISKIQVSVYDANGFLAFRRYLDENGVPFGISTIPERIVPARGSLDSFNPFYSFEEEMPLARLHYEVFLEKTSEKNRTC